MVVVVHCPCLVVIVTTQAKFLPAAEKPTSGDAVDTDSDKLLQPEIFAVQWQVGKKIRTSDEVQSQGMFF